MIVIQSQTMCMGCATPAREKRAQELGAGQLFCGSCLQHLGPDKHLTRPGDRCPCGGRNIFSTREYDPTCDGKFSFGY